MESHACRLKSRRIGVRTPARVKLWFTCICCVFCLVLSIAARLLPLGRSDSCSTSPRRSSALPTGCFSRYTHLFFDKQAILCSHGTFSTKTCDFTNLNLNIVFRCWSLCTQTSPLRICLCHDPLLHCVYWSRCHLVSLRVRGRWEGEWERKRVIPSLSCFFLRCRLDTSQASVRKASR